MTIPKILAPLLSRSHVNNDEKSPAGISSGLILSPVLPREPMSIQQLENNNLIALATTFDYAYSNNSSKETISSEDEEISRKNSSNKSVSSLNEGPYSNNSSSYTVASMSEGSSSNNCSSETVTDIVYQDESLMNAVVLHENPTSFRLSGNDMLIESAYYDKPVQQDRMYDMQPKTAYSPQKDNFNDMIRGYHPSPPADDELNISNYLKNTRSSSNDTIDDVSSFTKPGASNSQLSLHLASTEELLIQQHEEQKSNNFTQPTHSEGSPTVFKQDRSVSHFALDNDFKRTGRSNSFKQKLLKAVKFFGKMEEATKRQGSGMQSYRQRETYSSYSVSQKDQETSWSKNLDELLANRTLRNLDPTPIYTRLNKAGSLAFSLYSLNESSILPYMSPVMGSEAYRIKQLCDQNFFGRW